ncbi:MAG: Smr/MutS family protein [Desulfovibrio sp.]|nr:Smr/MutS family protein [Desulfovibrio sp.]
MSEFHAENNPFRGLDAKRFPGNVRDDKSCAVVMRRKEDKNSRRDASRQKKSEKAPDTAQHDDDAGLFIDAVGQVCPLRTRGREVATKLPPVSSVPSENSPANDLQKFMEGELKFVLALTNEYLEGHVVGLDVLTMNKLRAGELSPEAHIDLHSLNAVQAFETLRGFMRVCWYKGMRTVLAVPGRGRNSPNGIGVLREKLSHWLTQEPFKRVVLAFCTAQSHDGGLGGIYVLLRKYRKKDRICWGKMPADADLYQCVPHF